MKIQFTYLLKKKKITNIVNKVQWTGGVGLEE